MLCWSDYGPLLAAKRNKTISDRLIFEHLVRTHQGAVRAFLRRLTGNHALADDLAQDCFMKALSNLANLNDPSKAKAWLFTTAYRVFIDNYRKTKRRQDLMPEPPDPVPRAEGQPAMALDLSRAMADLAPDVRACLMLVLSEGLTHSEAARVTDLPLGTVKSHIARGRKTLQTALSAYNETVDDDA